MISLHFYFDLSLVSILILISPPRHLDSKTSIYKNVTDLLHSTVEDFHSILVKKTIMIFFKSMKTFRYWLFRRQFHFLGNFRNFF